jgi:predicted permease
MTDLRLAARRLLATPLFTVCAVLSLAVGVGVTTAVYSVVDALFLSDVGIPDPDRLVMVVIPADGRMLKGSLSQLDFDDLRAAQTSLSRLSASAPFSPALASTFTTELVAAEAVEGTYFQTLGVTMSQGRAIQPTDDLAGLRVAVLSHSLWRTRFGADPGIVGRTARIGGVSFDVIGVAPRGFHGLNAGFHGLNAGPTSTRLWIPLSAEASLGVPALAPPERARDRRRLQVFGRLLSPVTVATAGAELTAIAARLDAAFPAHARSEGNVVIERRWTARSLASIAEDNNALQRFGLTLVAIVALVLVVACTNLSNLVLARGTSRAQELTIRSALGASRWRLVREQCAESVLLAFGGGIAAYAVFQILRVLMDIDFQLGLPFGGTLTLEIHPSLDAAALAIAATSLAISLLVFGLEPALQLTRSVDLRGRLAESAGGIGPSRGKRQGVLLRWQVAIATGFFVIATMFVKHTIAEARHDSGVEMDRLGLAVLNVRAQGWDEQRTRRTIERLLEEARKDPVVESISVSAGMPFGVPGDRIAIAAAHEAALNSDVHRSALGVGATPSIFKTLGVPIVAGRAFDDRDQEGTAPVVVLSELTARLMFGTADAVGRQLFVRRQASQTLATVIGIARDTDVGRLLGDPYALVYAPLTQQSGTSLTIAARSTGDGSAVLPALREALRRTDPDLAVNATGTGRTILAGPFVILRALGVGTLTLGVLTLLLAMGGLFALQSHAVALRTREIGLRMSCGASTWRIKWMVLRDGYRPVLDGLVLGLWGGLAGRAIVRSYLDVDVAILDPWMLLVPIPLIAAAVCACYVPAHRASSIDPTVALRHL